MGNCSTYLGVPGRSICDNVIRQKQEVFVKDFVSPKLMWPGNSDPFEPASTNTPQTPADLLKLYKENDPAAEFVVRNACCKGTQFGSKISAFEGIVVTGTLEDFIEGMVKPNLRGFRNEKVTSSNENIGSLLEDFSLETDWETGKHPERWMFDLDPRFKNMDEGYIGGLEDRHAKNKEGRDVGMRLRKGYQYIWLESMYSEEGAQNHALMEPTMKLNDLKSDGEIVQPAVSNLGELYDIQTIFDGMAKKDNPPKQENVAARNEAATFVINGKKGERAAFFKVLADFNWRVLDCRESWEGIGEQSYVEFAHDKALGKTCRLILHAKNTLTGNPRSESGVGRLYRKVDVNWTKSR